MPDTDFATIAGSGDKHGILYLHFECPVDRAPHFLRYQRRLHGKIMDMYLESLSKDEEVSSNEIVTIGQVRQAFIDALKRLSKSSKKKIQYSVKCKDINDPREVMILSTNVRDLGIITENGEFSWGLYRDNDSYYLSGSLEKRDHLPGRQTSNAPVRTCYKILWKLCDVAAADGMISGATRLAAQLHRAMDSNLSIYARAVKPGQP